MSGTGAISFFVNVAVGAGEISAGALGVLGAVGGYVGDKLGGIASGSPNDITSNAKEQSAIFFAESSAIQKVRPINFNWVPASPPLLSTQAADKNSVSPASLSTSNDTVQQALEASRAETRLTAQRTQVQLNTTSAKLEARVKQDIQTSDYNSTVSLLAQSLNASSRMHQLHPESPISTPISLDLTRLFKQQSDASPAFGQVTISKQELMDTIKSCWTNKSPLPAYLQQVLKQHHIDLNHPIASPALKSEGTPEIGEWVTQRPVPTPSDPSLGPHNVPSRQYSESTPSIPVNHTGSPGIDVEALNPNAANNIPKTTPSFSDVMTSNTNPANNQSSFLRPDNRIATSFTTRMGRVFKEEKDILYFVENGKISGYEQKPKPGTLSVPSLIIDLFKSLFKGTDRNSKTPPKLNFEIMDQVGIAQQNQYAHTIVIRCTEKTYTDAGYPIDTTVVVEADYDSAGEVTVTRVKKQGGPNYNVVKKTQQKEVRDILRQVRENIESNAPDAGNSDVFKALQKLKL